MRAGAPIICTMLYLNSGVRFARAGSARLRNGSNCNRSPLEHVRRVIDEKLPLGLEILCHGSSTHYHNSRASSLAFISSNPREIPLQPRRFSTSIHPPTKNKYATFRQSLASRCQDDKDDMESNTGSQAASTRKHKTANGYEAAQQAVNLLAQRNKTWKRLAHLVELATSSDMNHQSIADIGCDHGLLSIALASSGKFEQVVGADISQRALEDGALEFHRKVMEVLERERDETISSLPVEFRVGNGLEPLRPGEADAVCLAGMGVDTMLCILNSPVPGDEQNNSRTRHIDYLQCQSLYLQPPTSRPSKLMKLYKELHNNGWILSDERIAKLKSRWYITCAFDRLLPASTTSTSMHTTSTSDTEKEFLLPGHFLSLSQDKDQKIEYDAYVEHQFRWLNMDLQRNGSLSDDDMIWREANLQQQETPQ